MEAWLWEHADDWLDGSPGPRTLAQIESVASEQDLPPDFAAFVAPALVGAPHERTRRWALQVSAAALRAEHAQRRAAQDVSEAFERAAIPHVFVKGCDFRYRLYPDPIRRLANDVDLMVAPGAARDATRLLEGLGWVPLEDRAPFLEGRHHELAFRAAPDVTLDLHISMVQPRRGRIDDSGIFERREAARVDGGALPVPCREDSLALCLVHIGRHEGAAEYVAFKHGLDLLLACEVWKDLDWEALADRTRDWRCQRMAGAGLFSWVPRLGSRIPGRALRALDPGGVSRWLALRTHRVLSRPRERARGAQRLSQLGRKFFFAEGWPERAWLVQELWRRARARVSW